MKQYIEFHHGVLCDTYEEQVNKQGFTYGDEAEFVQNIGFNLGVAYVHGLITDSEYDRILDRFQKKILINKKFLKRLVNMEE